MTDDSLSLPTCPIPAWRPDLEQYYLMTGLCTLPATMDPKLVREEINRTQQYIWDYSYDTGGDGPFG